MANGDKYKSKKELKKEGLIGKGGLIPSSPSWKNRMYQLIERFKVPSSKFENPSTESYEGKYPTMGGERLSELGVKNVDGGTDYYYKGTKSNPTVLGEVDLESGNVEGVYGDNPSFYGPKKKHKRKK